MSSANRNLRAPEQGILRPPSEKRSLLVRVVRGCPWNRCAFCPAFKNEQFSVRPLEEILSDIDQLALQQGIDKFSAAFLQDGDALVMPIERLVVIIKHLKGKFPNIRRITTYSRSSTLAARSLQDLKRLCQAGLNRIHVGVESAADEVLNLVNKGVSAKKQLEGCLNARQAGFELCCYFMPGLGGKSFTNLHADTAADFIRLVRPAHVRLRTCMVIENTGLEALWREGKFKPLGEDEIIAEIKRMLEGIKEVKTELVSDHRINLLLELRGQLPHDYNKLLQVIERYQQLPETERQLFIAGRRSNRIKILAELKQKHLRPVLKECAENYQVKIPVPVSLLY